MNKFFSAIKNKIVWIVIGIIAVLAGACLYQIISPLMGPVFDYPPSSAILQVQGVEQKGYACDYPGVQKFSDVAETSNKALVTASPFSATLKFTTDEPPQAIRIQILDVATLDKPTTEETYSESYFSWRGGCFANKANVTLTKDFGLKNEQTFTLELKRGLYVINVSAKWANIDQVVYAFLVEVK